LFLLEWITYNVVICCGISSSSCREVEKRELSNDESSDEDVAGGSVCVLTFSLLCLVCVSLADTCFLFIILLILFWNVHVLSAWSTGWVTGRASNLQKCCINFQNFAVGGPGLT